MLNIKHKHKLEWNYEGWLEGVKKSTPYTQNDWNQTLITKMNMMSAKIHNASLRGGADRIRCNTKMLNLIKSIEYFFDEGDRLSKGHGMSINNKYFIVVDDLIHDDEIYMYRGRELENLEHILIPNVEETELFGDVSYGENGWIETVMSEVSFRVSKDKKEIAKYGKKMVGKIKILNYKGDES